MQKTASQIADEVLEKLAVTPGKAYQALLRRGVTKGLGPGGLKALERQYPRTFRRMQSATRKAPAQQVFDPAARKLKDAGGNRIVDKTILREGYGSPIRGNRKMEYQTTQSARDVFNEQLKADISKYQPRGMMTRGSPERAMKARSQLHQADAELAGADMDWADFYGDVR